MTRVVQPQGQKGSLRWIQHFVNHHPLALKPAALPEIAWVSPLASDEFAEYRDASMLARLGHEKLASSLSEFWPRGGPQWDALGRLPDGGVVLVEAKAHLAEFVSPGSAAGRVSRDRIEKALKAVSDALGVEQDIPWVDHYYQYTNRLAHLWWFVQHKVDAHLLFVSFIGDRMMHGPDRAEDWYDAFARADAVLGLPPSHALSGRIHHVMPDVSLLGD